MAEGNALVFFPGLQLADPQLGGDKAGALQRGAAIQGLVQRHGDAGFLDHALTEVENDVQFPLTFGDIDQPQLVDGQFGVAFDEAIDQLRGVAASATYGDHFKRLVHKHLFHHSQIGLNKGPPCIWGAVGRSHL
ncbi:hypothetical protein D3C84_870390 [compost metagenome]